MSLFPWRRRALFHVSDAPLDPDELRLRFRMRVLKISFLVGMATLGYPVLLGKQESFRTDREARRFMEVLLEARLQSSTRRTPIGLQLVDHNSWQITEYPGSEDCDANSPNRVMKEKFSQDEMTWRPLFLENGNTTGIGADVSQICFHPVRGLLVDSKPLESGWLYLLVAPKTEMAANNQEQIRQVVLTNFGSEIQVGKPN